MPVFTRVDGVLRQGGLSPACRGVLKQRAPPSQADENWYKDGYR